MKSISMSREVNTGPVRYIWERKITVNDTAIEITDQVKSDEKVKITVLFHFAPSSIVEIGSNGVTRIENPDWIIAMRQKVSNKYMNTCEMSNVFHETNREQTSPELQTSTEGNDVQIQTLIYSQ